MKQPIWFQDTACVKSPELESCPLPHRLFSCCVPASASISHFMCRERSQAVLYNLTVPITTPMMGNIRPFLDQSLWKGSWKSDYLRHQSFEISLPSFSLTSLSQFSFPVARQTCGFLTQVHFWPPSGTLTLDCCSSDSGVSRASFLLPRPLIRGEDSEVCL